MKTFTVTCIIFLFMSLYARSQAVDSIRVDAQLENALSDRGISQLSVDSVRIFTWSDSVKKRILQKFHYDSLTSIQRADSFQLPTDKLTAKMDSLRHRKDELIQTLNGKKDKLLEKSRSRLAIWQSKIRDKVNDLQANLKAPVGAPSETNNLSGKMPDLQNVNAPELPSLNNAGPANLQLPDVPELEMPDMKSIDLSADLSTINERLDFDGFENLEEIQEKVGAGAEQLEALKDIKTNPDKAIETAAENLGQIDAVKEELGSIEQFKDNGFVEMADKLKDPSAMQEEVKQIVVQQAVNHFEGKEQVLQQAMEKLEKYKNKYESVSSLSDIKKLPKNSMKGKPFRQRFIPGVAIQVLHNGDILLDMNPYAGYRITGRLFAGAGWNQRIGYSTKHDYFTSTAVIYGPRTFAEVKTWKGFIARGEFEWMNTEVPPRLRGIHSGESYREWVRTAFIGLKREYRFLKNVSGTAMIMFSVYNDHRKSPYGDVINSRFGFEFPIKSKKR